MRTRPLPEHPSFSLDDIHGDQQNEEAIARNKAGIAELDG
tara:strand:+ start:1167 stop:1286 length:120 start_codon:yes stop_codon:yes gene_type:complete